MLPALHLMNEQDTQSVIAHLRAGDHLRAAITIRRSTGCGLKEAVLVLKGMIRELGLDQSDGESEMGMSAEIMAMGPFSRSIVRYLEYPEDFYKDTREGVVVLRRLFTVYEGSGTSRKLATCFGIEAWDFNQHHLDPMRVDLDTIREMFDVRDVCAFLALRDAGFQFYFIPNG